MLCSICKQETPELKEGLCFTCKFWSDIIEEEEIHPVYNGTCYCLSTYLVDTRTPQWNGFGGQWFKITFMDGRVFYTNNLFHNGDVPAEWREQLPDNCKIETNFDRSELEPYKSKRLIRRNEVFAKGMLDCSDEATTKFFT